MTEMRLLDHFLAQDFLNRGTQAKIREEFECILNETNRKGLEITQKTVDYIKDSIPCVSFYIWHTTDPASAHGRSIQKPEDLIMWIS